VSQKVLLLGASGFIGSHLENHLKSTYQILTVNRKSSDFLNLLRMAEPDVIINCSASAPTADFFESLEANVNFQMRCLEVLTSQSQKPIKWVQVASYFELQIVFGRRDNYSIHKSLCRALLEQMSERGLINLTTIFLPHVFGRGEMASRIIPSITSELLANKEMQISKGDQYLPILGVQDTCVAISMAIQTDQDSCSASPMWYGKLKDLANLMHQTLKKGNLKVNPSKVSIDDSFPPVQFPPSVNNWSPSFGFEDFLATLENK
jgi:nucleoside-diphosphate-sugar epimerase